MITKLHDIKYLLLHKFHVVEKMSLEEADREGVQYRNMVLGTRIYTLLKDKEYTISELSRVIGVSRQATHKSIQILKEDGFVYTTDSPTNKKVKIIKLTEFGKEMLNLRETVMDRVEDRISQKIGEDKLQVIKDILSEDWE